MGKKAFDCVIAKVAVIAFVSVDPAMETCFVFFSAIDLLETGTNLDGVWSIFILREGGISYFSTNLAIWWWNINPASFLAPSGISGLPVVLALFYVTHSSKRAFCPDEESRLIAFKCSLLLFDIRALAAAMATTALTTPPFFLYAIRNFLTVSSSLPKSKGLPRFKEVIFFVGEVCGLCNFRAADTLNESFLRYFL